MWHCWQRGIGFEDDGMREGLDAAPRNTNPDNYGSHRLRLTLRCPACLQFKTRLLSGLSSENAGTSTSNCSPLSLTIW